MSLGSVLLLLGCVVLAFLVCLRLLVEVVVVEVVRYVALLLL